VHGDKFELRNALHCHTPTVRQHKMRAIGNIAFKVISILGLIMNGFFAFINLSEWYLIGFLDKTKDYPFGGEGPVPYYYKTKELYVAVNQIWGIIFGILTIIMIWILFKGKRKHKITIVLISWILIILKISHGLIGVI
jgi:hypothetical protein